MSLILLLKIAHLIKRIGTKRRCLFAIYALFNFEKQYFRLAYPARFNLHIKRV